MAEPLTKTEAFVGIAVCAAYADGSMDADEDEEFAAQLLLCRVLAHLDEDAIHDAMMKVDGIAHDDGDDALLALAAAAIPPELRATAFYLGADIVAADGELGAEERAFVERLRTRLDVPAATAAQILDVVQVLRRA